MVDKKREKEISENNRFTEEPEGRNDRLSYRNLSSQEQKLLIHLYDIHDGNLSAMARDPNCIFKSRAQLWHYKKIYRWQSIFERIRTQRVKDFNRQLQEKLKQGKTIAIIRALKLLEPREIETTDPFGKYTTTIRYPSYKEIVTAWEIIKTELGEPTKVTKQQNEDLPETEKHRQELKDLMSHIKNGSAEPNKNTKNDEAGSTEVASGNAESSPASC